MGASSEMLEPKFLQKAMYVFAESADPKLVNKFQRHFEDMVMSGWSLVRFESSKGLVYLTWGRYVESES